MLRGGAGVDCSDISLRASGCFPSHRRSSFKRKRPACSILERLVQGPMSRGKAIGERWGSRHLSDLRDSGPSGRPGTFRESGQVTARNQLLGQ